MKSTLKKIAKRVLKTLPSKPKPDLLEVAEQATQSLPPFYTERLLSMYRGEPQVGGDGQIHTIDTCTKISPTQGMWLHDFCLSTKPESILEIGMAYGYSSLYFLAAIEKNGQGSLTSIDPFQRCYWKGVGLAHGQAAAEEQGMKDSFQLIEERSDRASTDLARSDASPDIVFIDGNHRYDDVLVDFYLYAPLCAMNGHVILDDMWMSSIQTVASFIRNNRADFVEVSTDQPNICVFQKVGEDDRSWDHFKRFKVS